MKYLIIIVLVGLAIFLHELGHFLAARMAGIPIARFSLGFGPRLYSCRFGENKTEYRISLIPLGGYVLPDMQPGKEYLSIPVSRRLVFTAGGPLFNMFGAFLFFAAANSAAGGFGYETLLVRPLEHSLYFLEEMVGSLGLIVSRPEELSGVVGIVVGGAELLRNGFIDTLLFGAVINLNVAVINLLPVPVLDGGQILLSLVEKVAPGLRKLRVPLAIGGWALVIWLMIYVTSNDISKIINS